jgi:hypothetical protein
VKEGKNTDPAVLRETGGDFASVKDVDGQIRELNSLRKLVVREEQGIRCEKLAKYLLGQ